MAISAVENMTQNKSDKGSRSSSIMIPDTPEEHAALLAALRAKRSNLEELIQVLDPTDEASRAKKTEVIPAPLPTKPPTLRERIQHALTKESLDPAHLAKAIGATREKVMACMTELREEGLVYNVGFEDEPIWTWRVGDAVDTSTLIDVVKRLISERPMYLRNVVRATGAKESRVSGAMVEVQRMYRVVDAGHGGHAKQYYLLGEHIRDATIAPKVTKGGPITHGTRRSKREAKPR